MVGGEETGCLTNGDEQPYGHDDSQSSGPDLFGEAFAQEVAQDDAQAGAQQEAWGVELGIVKGRGGHLCPREAL